MSSTEAMAIWSQGFPTLLAGRHIQLGRVAKQTVLDKIKQSLDVSWRSLVTVAKTRRAPA